MDETVRGQSLQVSSNYFANVNNNGNANYNNASNENGVRPISHPCILSRILTHGNGKGKIVRSEPTDE